MIPYDSPEAAEFRTDTPGWVSRHGRFFGRDEHSARYDGCTHVPCMDCGVLIEKRYVSRCRSCADAKETADWAKLPRKPWDETTPVCVYMDDRYFFNREELEEYCEDHEVAIEKLQLVHCKAVRYPEIDLDDRFAGYISDEADIPGVILDAAEELNRIIREYPAPACWEPDKIAVDLDM